MNWNWKLVSGVMLAVMAVGVAINFKTIKRYVRITTM